MSDNLINSRVATLMCDVVEDFTHLEDIFREMRWRMLRGELFEMRCIMPLGRKRARELRAHLESLDYALEAAALPDYSATAIDLMHSEKAAGLKVVPKEEKTNG